MRVRNICRVLTALAFSVVSLTSRLTFAGSSDLPSQGSRAERLLFLGLGTGLILDDQGGDLGPAAGLGLRRRIDHFGLELAAFNFILHTGSQTASFVRLMGLWYLSPGARTSIHVGLGASLAEISVQRGDEERYGGRGIQGEFCLGLSLRKGASTGLFVQSEVSVPTYQITTYDGLWPRWAMSMAVKVGIGWLHALAP